MLVCVLGCKSSEGLPATVTPTRFRGVLELPMAVPRGYEIPAVFLE
jgi:hypothetical protein